MPMTKKKKPAAESKIMSAQTFQFEIDFSQKRPPAVQERIVEGMRQADEHARMEWKRWVDGCIQYVARTHEEFTVDDVIFALEALPDPPSTHNLGALGPRMKEVSKTLGYMEATDRLKRSIRPVTHGNLHRVWRSLIVETKK
jgi:hypothetical protein